MMNANSYAQNAYGQYPYGQYAYGQNAYSQSASGQSAQHPYANASSASQQYASYANTAQQSANVGSTPSTAAGSTFPGMNANAVAATAAATVRTAGATAATASTAGATAAVGAPAPAVAGTAPATGAQDDTQKAIPTANALREELKRSSQRSRFRTALRNAVFAILAVAAIAVLVSMLFMPVLRIFGSSMTPTLSEGSMVVAVKNPQLEQGDIVAFYYNNKVLVKRVIAGPGSWVDIDKSGKVTVDGEVLDEPYVSELAFGECDIDLPYQVPENRYFVMGDHRSTSVDSRNSTIGCISDDQLVGKVLASVWPLSEFGFVS